MTAYDEGRQVGEMMARDRADGNYDCDCRWDLADAAKKPGDYFTQFKQGLEDGLAAEVTG
jgi:hypothetical protein